MDKLTSMRAFVAVVDAGGFSQAADRLDVSKSLISKRVSQLEEQLGVRLLQRTTRRVSPTSSGEIYCAQSRLLLAELDDLDASVQSSNAVPRGELRITAPITFSELHILSIASEFSRCYPDVRLTIELTDHYIDLIEERIDVAIRIDRLRDSSLVARKLGEMSLMLCASAEYLTKRGTLNSLDDLIDHDCVHDSNTPGGPRWSFGPVENPRVIEVDPKLTVNSDRAARDLMLAGHGIAYIPSFVLSEQLKSGEVIELFPEHRLPPYGIYAVYPHRKHLSAKIKLFIDTAIEYFKTLPN